MQSFQKNSASSLSRHVALENANLAFIDIVDNGMDVEFDFSLCHNYYYLCSYFL